MRDPYAVLGVARNASGADIKSAYRRLAKSLHPDLHPGEADADTRFQELQGAYRILKDPAMRRRYDRGFVDAQGNPQASPFEEALREATRRNARPGPRPSAKTGSGAREDLIADLMANLKRGRRGIVETIPLTISFAEAVRGARKTVQLPSGSLVGVTIPPGTENGQTVRLRNVNPKAVGENKPPVSDALEVEVAVIPDPRFALDGLDLVCQLPVTLSEAVLGGQIRVPAPGGALKVAIPPGSSSGTVLKLKGQGIRKGDGRSGNLRVELKIVLPPDIDPELEAFIRNWSGSHPYEVRGS